MRNIGIIRVNYTLYGSANYCYIFKKTHFKYIFKVDYPYSRAINYANILNYSYHNKITLFYIKKYIPFKQYWYNHNRIEQISTT